MTKQQVTVPDIGGAEGAEVIELLVAVGDEISVDQSLIVLESDKASMEIPSTVAGVLVELLVTEGQELAEGAPLAVIEVAGDTAAVPEPQEVDSEPLAEVIIESAPAESAPSVAAEAADAVSSRVPVPDIGTDEAVEVIELSVKVGDTVAEGDSLVVLESDKASMEVPAPFGGEITEIQVSEGDSVKQGDALLLMKTSAAPQQDPVVAEPLKPAEAAPAIAPAAPVPKPQVAAPLEADAVESSGGIYAGPAVRKLAREFGVTLAEVSGSGPRGRLLKEDLQKYVQDRLNKPATATAGGAGLPLVPEMDFSKFGEVLIRTVEVRERKQKTDKICDGQKVGRTYS